MHVEGGWVNNVVHWERFCVSLFLCFCLTRSEGNRARILPFICSVLSYDYLNKIPLEVYLCKYKFLCWHFDLIRLFPKMKSQRFRKISYLSDFKLYEYFYVIYFNKSLLSNEVLGKVSILYRGQCINTSLYFRL